MGILTRFTDIMKSNINALLDKCEDPAKMIDQTLRDLREDRDLTQTEVAKILGCTQQTYSRYETGEITIDIYNLIKLADFYNTSCDYLLGITNISKPYKKDNK